MMSVSQCGSKYSVAMWQQQRSEIQTGVRHVCVPLFAQARLLQVARDNGQRETCALYHTASSEEPARLLFVP